MSLTEEEEEKLKRARKKRRKGRKLLREAHSLILEVFTKDGAAK